MTTIALSIVNVLKRYSRDVTIGPISLEVRRGEFFSLLGESGSGKTTLLRCIAGFEEVTSGDILLDGAPIQDKAAHLRNVGLVFQNYALFPHRTVFDNVAFGLTLRKVPKPEIAKRVNNILRLVGMPDLGERYPAQLSGGQQQRVAIARAVVLEPPLILFDEPLSNLDAKLRVQLRFELRALQRRLGMTCIFVTHDQAEAFALSDRVAVLANGGIAQMGTPNEIYEAPASAYVAEFVGSSNQITGMVVRREDGLSLIRSKGGFEIWSGSTSFSEGTNVVAMFRPEQVDICDPLTRPKRNGFACTLTDLTYLGEDTHLRIAPENAAESLLVVKKSKAAWSQLMVNSPVDIGIEPSRVHLFRG
jgi:ABC-type Fe3+/spermidine/putrescine transport system ATPase subunit